MQLFKLVYSATPECQSGKDQEALLYADLPV